MLNHYLSLNSPMLLLIQDLSCSENLGEYVKKIRMEGSLPCFIWDMYYDIQLTNEILLGAKSSILEFATDGSVLRLADNNLNVKENSFKEIINTALPKCTIPDD